jgi:hypothetical protein
MRKGVAITAAAVALLTQPAHAAEPRPYLPSGPSTPDNPSPSGPVTKDAPPTTPGSPAPSGVPQGLRRGTKPDESRGSDAGERPVDGATRQEAPGPDEVGAQWSPTATWRPVGPSTYDEDLSLAELLNMSATVATKSSATVSRTLASSRFTAPRTSGASRYTLADLADVTAGYSSYSIYGEKVLETRGQKAGSFVNNKHLVLIDGIPVNHGRGNRAMIDENFPLFFANRVEFLKGPASALYGTGAFFGVVNVVPKELEDRGFRAEWRAGFGSNQAEKRVMANGMYRDGVRHAAIYAGFYDKGPSQAFTGTVDNPNNRLWDNQRAIPLLAMARRRPLAGLKAGFIYASKNGGSAILARRLFALTTISPGPDDSVPEYEPSSAGFG